MSFSDIAFVSVSSWSLEDWWCIEWRTLRIAGLRDPENMKLCRRLLIMSGNSHMQAHGPSQFLARSLYHNSPSAWVHVPPFSALSAPAHQHPPLPIYGGLHPHCQWRVRRWGVGGLQLHVQILPADTTRKNAVYQLFWACSSWNDGWDRSQGNITGPHRIRWDFKHYGSKSSEISHDKV